MCSFFSCRITTPSLIEAKSEFIGSVKSLAIFFFWIFLLLFFIILWFSVFSEYRLLLSELFITVLVLFIYIEHGQIFYPMCSTKLPSVKNVKDPKISKLFEIPTQSIAMNQHCIYFSPFLSSLSFLGLLHISLSSKTYFSFPQTFFPHFIIQYYFSNSSFLDRYIHRRNFSQTYMYISLRKFHRNFPLSDHAVNRLT